MNPVERLASNLLSESRAYGYTLCIWGGGEMLVTLYGTPDLVDIVVFVAGAVVAFGALAAIAFGSAFATAEADHESNPIVASTVHVVATLGSVLLILSDRTASETTLEYPAAVRRLQPVDVHVFLSDSMSHLVAVVALAAGVPAAVGFAVVGFQATTTYNGLLLFEQAAVRLFA